MSRVSFYFGAKAGVFLRDGGFLVRAFNESGTFDGRPGGDIFVSFAAASEASLLAAKSAGQPLPVGESWLTALAASPPPPGETWVLPLALLPAGEGWLLPLTGSSALAPVAADEAPPLAMGFFQSGGLAPIVSLDPLSGPGTSAVDMSNKTLLTGGAQDELLGKGSDDVLVIGGSVGAVSLAGAGGGYERIVLLSGSAYSLSAADSNVAAGHVLAINAIALGAHDSVAFDGSAERDGSFLFHGGAGGDTFRGGAGADVIYGMGGGDTLAGGAGADRFVYTRASDSSGRDYDTLADFNFGEDKIDLPVSVSGFAAAVTHGALSNGSFDADLAKALGGLGAGQAALFTPDKGGLAGEIFLVVDGNGQAGYQPGEDYVFHLGAPPPADLSNPGFFV